MADDPLTGPPPAEVPLPRAPLVRVIAQVRFPIVANLEKAEFIAAFQDAIRDDYPITRREPRKSLIVGGPVQLEVQSAAKWQFDDRDHRWRVTLANDFLALETDAYTSRADFVGRFQRLSWALAAHVAPAAVDRVGVRYVDRLTGAALDALPDLIQPALLGPLGTSWGRHALAAVTECLVALPDEGGQLRARWGAVPAGTSLDPNAIEAVDTPSWVLDIDAFIQAESTFEAEGVAEQVNQLARRCYALFRWSVTNRFLAQFGGPS